MNDMAAKAQPRRRPFDSSSDDERVIAEIAKLRPMDFSTMVRLALRDLLDSLRAKGKS